MTLFRGIIGARIGLRLNQIPNLPFFDNRTILMSLIKALSCPDLTSNWHLFIPGKRGRYCPIMGIIWGSIWAYFGKWRFLNG
jgi:hypothetical protein